MYEKCLRNGVNIHQGGPHSTLTSLITEADGVVKGIKTVNGKEHYADLVILATGAWTASLVDMEDTLIATGHAVVHFKPEGQDNAYFTEGFPVWAGDISHLGKVHLHEELHKLKLLNVYGW
jgi:sarcosine oxidase/L-pipecolate oxidase